MTANTPRILALSLAVSLALGACFGRVVTLDSPRARPPGDFSWGETLWHEMAHVITLQLSRQRVPPSGSGSCNDPTIRPL